MALRAQYASCGHPSISLGSRQRVVAVRAMADTFGSGKLLKKPEMKRPEAPPRKLFDEQAPLATEAEPATHAVPATAAPPAASVATSGKPAVTIEYQRQRAKEMRSYFQERKQQEQAVKSQLFGWTPANEISNGRWVMFGFAVGLLTEYATGVDFPEQLKLMVSYLGILDLE